MVVAAAMLAIGCSKGSDDAAQPRTTVPTAPALTTTTNPYAVPEVIDVAYVNRVLAGLDAVTGDALRMAVDAGYVTDEVLKRLRALYAEQTLGIQVDGFTNDARAGRESFRGGNQKTTVTKLFTGSTTCIFAQVARDLSAVVESPSPELATQWVALRPLDPTRDPSRLNPTPWIYVYDGFKKDHSQPANPCGES